MCLIGFRWAPGSGEPLLLLGNRDEFYDRPSAPLGWWAGGRLLAGRDLRAGGTWLGVTREGRWAAVTNFRQAGPPRPEAPSRGQLPVRFLEGGLSAAAFLEALQGEASRYAPFNLLLSDGGTPLGYQSRNDRVVPLGPGLHVLSNGDFDEPWPKAEALRRRLAAAPEDDEALLALLEDDRPFPEAELPRTGVPLDWERALSPIFVRTPAYGTRVSTLLRLGRETVSVLEQRFTAEGREGRTEVVFTRSGGLPEC
ncbi:MAG TPA: NRDE family protein [Holophagaceae bacterium]